MGRILFQFVLPIVLPTMIYVAWLMAERRRAEAPGGAAMRQWKDAPWLWLVALGVFFAILVALATALIGGESTEGVYVPPRLKDGEIVPGHVEPAPPRPPGRGVPR
jgi:hypothetical protein